jgi:hypothetical protein
MIGSLAAPIEPFVDRIVSCWTVGKVSKTQCSCDLDVPTVILIVTVKQDMQNFVGLLSDR